MKAPACGTAALAFFIVAITAGQLNSAHAKSGAHRCRKSEPATMAVIYYWKAKPGKEAEYSKYIRDVAEPVDADAQRRGAFFTVTTYVSSKPDSPWTHMRVFEVRDEAQAGALGKALDDATKRAHPDPADQEKMRQYGATLRDPAGSQAVQILR